MVDPGFSAEGTDPIFVDFLTKTMKVQTILSVGGEGGGEPFRSALPIVYFWSSSMDFSTRRFRKVP